MRLFKALGSMMHAWIFSSSESLREKSCEPKSSIYGVWPACGILADLESGLDTTGNGHIWDIEDAFP